MIAFVLVVWFGYNDRQSSFAVSSIASQAECHRLAAQLKGIYPGPGTRADYYPYRMAK